MEIWDAYTVDRQATGQQLSRGQVIPAGLFHLVVDILVQHQDGEVLLMQRSHDRAGYPGYYEASAGGSVLSGETTREAARRELYEETGVEAHDLVLIDQKRFDQDQCLFDFFLAKTTVDKDSIKLQEGETIGYRWLNLGDLEDFLAEHSIIPRQIDLLRRLKAGEFD